MALCDNVWKYGTVSQATGDSIIRRMRFACWVIKATDDPFGSSTIQRGGNCGKWINIFWDHKVTTRCKRYQGWRKRQRRYPVTISWRVKVKVKFTLVQALRLCAGPTAHRQSGGIALLFLDHGTRKGWGVSVTPRPLFTPGKDPSWRVKYNNKKKTNMAIL